MNVLEKPGLALVNRLDPEFGHGMTIRALKLGLVGGTGPVSTSRTRTTLAGIELPNPVGLAAGLDKNAEVVRPLLATGAGFLEIGAVTPKPQTGNRKPRLFRLAKDRAIINRMGFNSDGAAAVKRRLSRHQGPGVIGLNLGSNTESPDPGKDFASVIEACGPFVSFATINVSSPNTRGLRNFQQADALGAIAERVVFASGRLQWPIPVFVKISPDLEDTELRDVVSAIPRSGLSGVIATNTTTDRSGLTDALASESGGLSGKPLFDRSTLVLSKTYSFLDGHCPIIGVGGVSSADDAYRKIRAGASAVQLYSALVYSGFSLVRTIVLELDRLLERDGFESVSRAVGADLR